MNRSAKGLLIEITNLDGFSWQIADDLPNSPSFLSAKLAHYMLFGKPHKGGLSEI